MIFVLGVEYFKNETGMEFDGKNVKSFEAKTLEEASGLAKAFIKSLWSNTDSLHANIQLMQQSTGSNPKFGLRDGEREIKDKADIFAMQICGSVGGFDSISNIIRGEAYWFHLFIKAELDTRPVGMFDTDPAASLEATPKSFEEIMSDAITSSTQQPLEYTEAYFNRAGDEIPGVPDFWQVQAGLH